MKRKFLIENDVGLSFDKIQTILDEFGIEAIEVI